MVGVTAAQVKGDLAKLHLTSPVCTKEQEKVALSRRVDKHWRLIGWGQIQQGAKMCAPPKQALGAPDWLGPDSAGRQDGPAQAHLLQGRPSQNSASVALGVGEGLSNKHLLVCFMVIGLGKSADGGKLLGCLSAQALSKLEAVRRSSAEPQDITCSKSWADVSFCIYSE